MTHHIKLVYAAGWSGSRRLYRAMTLCGVVASGYDDVEFRDLRFHLNSPKLKPMLCVDCLKKAVDPLAEDRDPEPLAPRESKDRS